MIVVEGREGYCEINELVLKWSRVDFTVYVLLGCVTMMDEVSRLNVLVFYLQDVALQLECNQHIAPLAGQDSSRGVAYLILRKGYSQSSVCWVGYM